MEGKVLIMDCETMERALRRIAHQIIENTQGAKNLAMVGIQRRGVTLAQCLARYIQEFEGVSVPLGTLDITYYRDDLTRIHTQPVLQPIQLGLDVDGKEVVLVDDVLYTGRTARAAMDAIMDQGRPDKIRLAVLVDRGHRELPIRADFVGKNIPTSETEVVHVHVREFDEEECVFITKTQ